MRFHYYMIKGIRKNAHRTDDFLSAVYNQIKAMSEILWDVYCSHNHLLYGIWSQDSHYKETDVMWFRCCNYYGWTGSARYYYDLVAHKIQAHPDGWSDKLWYKDLQKKKKFSFGVPDHLL